VRLLDHLPHQPRPAREDYRRAALVVCAAAVDVDEAAELLDLLGLVEELRR
jgi:hypothetical protein